MNSNIRMRRCRLRYIQYYCGEKQNMQIPIKKRRCAKGKSEKNKYYGMQK